jgi:hypothetical protein
MSETPDHADGDHHEPRLATDYAGAIYGSIVATALIGALRETDITAKEMTLNVAGTMIVLWIAHTWAAIAGERIHLGHGFLGHRVKALGREEWPIVEAGFVPLIPLVLGWMGVLSLHDAALLAIALGIGQLFLWGFVLGRRVYHTWLGAILAALGDGAVGVVIVLLEIWVNH